MRFKTLVLVFSVLMISGIAVAHEDLEDVQQEFNQADIPEHLGYVIGDQRMNIDITAEQGTESFAVEMDGVEMEEIREEHFENPTLEAEIDMEEVQEVMEAENPLEALNQKLKDGDISYETYTVTNSVRFFAVESLISIGGIF